VEWAGKRYVLRCNPQTRARERARRADQWARVQAKITARNLKGCIAAERAGGACEIGGECSRRA
jgi:aminoglycoside phosphotransferase (APT) family kinase protein